MEKPKYFFCDKEITTLEEWNLKQGEIDPTKDCVELGKIGNKYICSLCFGNLYGMVLYMDKVMKQTNINYRSILMSEGGEC